MSRVLVLLGLVGCAAGGPPELEGSWERSWVYTDETDDGSDPVVCVEAFERFEFRADGTYSEVLRETVDSEPEGCLGATGTTGVDIEGRWVVLDDQSSDLSWTLVLQPETSVAFDDQTEQPAEAVPVGTEAPYPLGLGEPVGERRWVWISGRGVYWEES